MGKVRQTKAFKSCKTISNYYYAYVIKIIGEERKNGAKDIFEGIDQKQETVLYNSYSI